LYLTLGGVERLGPAISPPTVTGEYLYQYLQNALLVRTTQVTGHKRIQLAPLGLQMAVDEPPVPPPNDSDALYVGGHAIYPEFVPLYQQLGGLQVVGRPLTEVRYNPEKARLEQYFENLGFYRLDRDPPGAVRLLAYGAFVCDLACRFRAPQASIPTRQGTVPEPFASAVARLGPSFVGRVISPPYLASNGLPQVIFDHLVLYADGDRVFARPIVETLGFLPHPLAAPMDDDRVVFYPIQDGLGHNIPTVFSDYLAQHGGLDIAGPPISELFLYREGVYRQCFTNLCLDYHRNAPQGHQIRPTPLGMTFKAERYTEVVEQNLAPQTAQSLTVRLSETRPIVNSQQDQEIHIYVFKGKEPQARYEASIFITLPDGSEKEMRLLPTDETGHTTIRLRPIQAPNGTIIPYRVCLVGFNPDDCIRESFLIWGNP
jgi:hypothetical protein